MPALYFFDAAMGRGVWGPHVTDAAWQLGNLALAKALAEAKLGLTLAEHLADADLGPAASLLAVIEAGQVVSVGVDPAWVAPPPPPDPIEELKASLNEVKTVVAGNLAASEHDRRWLAQKEEVKNQGIPWIKANPTATQAEFQQAVFAAMASELPAGEPIVVNPDGIIASYALAAKERGLIAEASFISLRDLVVTTSDKELAKLLAKL